MELVAFWKYDQYPYFLGGHVTKITSTGKVETTEFGVGHTFKPILVLPEEEGESVIKDLDDLASQYVNEQKRLQENFKIALQSRIPSLKEFIS